MATGAERGHTVWARLPSMVRIVGQVETAQAGGGYWEWGMLLS